MSTAEEIRMKIGLARPIFERIQEQFYQNVVTYGSVMTEGREVCARRARKLRRRGEYCICVGRTSTGKARYQWQRAVSLDRLYR